MPFYALACFFVGTVVLVFARQIATRHVAYLQRWHVNRPWITKRLSVGGEIGMLRMNGILLIVLGLAGLLYYAVKQ